MKSYLLIYYSKLFTYYFFNSKYPDNSFTNYFLSSTYKKIESKRLYGKKKRIIFMCDGLRNHGGLTDRMKGILTTYYEAKKKGISFYINWLYPFNLIDYLQPTKQIDWRISSNINIYNLNICHPVILDKNRESWKNIIKKMIFKRFLSQKKTQLVYTNLDYANIHFRTLYNELFKPSKKLQDQIDYHLKMIGAPFWSFTFRFGNLFGDFKDIVGPTMPKYKQSELLQRNLQELKKLLQNIPVGYKVLITSDSFLFLQEIKKIDCRIYFVEGKPEPMINKNISIKNKCWIKSFLDQNLIMHAEKVFLLKTKGMYESSFPSFAAQISGRPYILHEF